MISSLIQSSSNELFIFIAGTGAYLLMLALPQRFTKRQIITMLLISSYWSCFFDTTLCVNPFDYYDINDTPFFDLWDLFSFVMFGPYTYLLIYAYTEIPKNRTTYFFFIIVWTLIAIASEALAWHANVYQYKNGYQMFYSLPIYLIVISITLMYHTFFVRKKNELL
ncbi:hypothetical protein [Sporolactobacillus terrae]|uniref:Uncharacterized protein n=1 Tax=Sporolactobacillus terrae TaxID=269673 RepID=A0A410D8W5_9BACL|nr:hypothetical protein [Sporolactobacillus terrae]QAA22524.1 hypothetical protein C0674_07735 [Sporolactobacillus terrae]QAA25498.1 hypothetical protein C0679_07715 [Sporolactobacillus terrae]UAK17309.1 hypothetical protein K7399_05055 [Sporolactobacillus terrae]BBN98839.1 hypothetical protein St703_15440 [Sporolactobacillus terrae]